MTLPYQILAAILTALAMFGSGFYAGHDWSQTKAQAELAKQREAQLIEVKAHIKRADEASAKLAQAEGRITIKTIEVIKRVPYVTRNVPCLSPAAVGLLQPGANDPEEAAGEPAAEGAEASATDTDIAYWIAGANQQYNTCAERLNALVDWHATEKE
jgi:hypothetical protein